MLDDGEQNPAGGLQEADEHTQRKLPAVDSSCFRAFEVTLGVLYLLTLAGISTRYILVTLEKEQLQKEVKLKDKMEDTKTNLTQLQSSYDKLSKNHSQLQEEVKKLKEKIEEKCPDRWTRFGSSCYFKSTESKTWSDSRRDCQDKGADLVMINSKEEQEFIRNMRGESWIGLRAKNTSSGSKWEWVDGSALTETFLAPGWTHVSSSFRGVCCDSDRKWTGSYDPESKTFICEK
uniref:C-type lectin domain-containing protein n=1 Tax=Oreochromis aureus TaxID=47969 RepID=A0AAZ1WYN2_OREAU